eukprot:350157-Chlamydomonas_euryale.AAC.4
MLDSGGHEHLSAAPSKDNVTRLGEPGAFSCKVYSSRVEGDLQGAAVGLNPVERLRGINKGREVRQEGVQLPLWHRGSVCGEDKDRV